MSSYIWLTARVRFCVINLRRNKDKIEVGYKKLNRVLSLHPVSESELIYIHLTTKPHKII